MKIFKNDFGKKYHVGKMFALFDNFTNKEVLHLIGIMNLKFESLELGNVVEHDQPCWKMILPSFVEFLSREHDLLVRQFNEVNDS